jgi:glycosyltransferase involved in cell wall biosynthesis
MNALAELTTGRPCKDLIFAPAKRTGFYRGAPPSVTPRGMRNRPPALDPGPKTDPATLLGPVLASAPQRALPVSATVICKNEAACIGQCLSSLEGLAEIVVVDSGSTDGTIAIVEAFSRQGFPVRLIHQAWLGYAGQKQFALDQARQPWVLSIDADEWLDDDLRSALPGLLAADPSIAGWKLRRMLTLYGRSAPVSRWTRPERIVRLVRRGRARFEADLLVHEGLIVDGETEVARKGLLRHERGLPLDEQMKKEIVYARLKAEQRLQRGMKPSRLKLMLNPPIYFMRIFLWNRFFLCGWAGFIHAATGAIYSLMTEAMHRQFYFARKARKPDGGNAAGRGEPR